MKSVISYEKPASPPLLPTQEPAHARGVLRARGVVFPAHGVVFHAPGDFRAQQFFISLKNCGTVHNLNTGGPFSQVQIGLTVAGCKPELPRLHDFTEMKKVLSASHTVGSERAAEWP